MASFLPRGGRWQAIVRRRGHKPQYKTFSKKLAAQRWAHALEEQIHSGAFQDRRSAERTTVTQLADWYETEVVPTRQKGTTDTYRLATIKRLLGHSTLAAVTPKVVVWYARARLKEGVSSDTVRRELDTLSDMFTSAVAFEEVALAANPVTLGRQLIRKLRVFKPKVKRKRRLKDGEEAVLMAIDRPGLKTIQDAALFDLETTMRRGELALMRPEHRNRKAHTLRIWQSKTDWKTGKEGREIPLTPAAEAILDRQPKHANGLVWGYTDAHSLTKAFRYLCNAVNAEHKRDPKKWPKIVDLRLHDLRHEAISRLFERGYTIQQVMVFSGHLDEETVHDYTHLSPEKIAAKMRR